MDAIGEDLRRAIEGAHSCSATPLYTVRVKEESEGKLVFEGFVHIFAVNHPKAHKCFTWCAAAKGSEKPRQYAVLAIAPILTPHDAVRFAMLGETPSKQ